MLVIQEDGPAGIQSLPVHMLDYSPDTVDDLGLELSLVPLHMLLPRLLILHLSSTFFLCGSRGEERKGKNFEV